MHVRVQGVHPGCLHLLAPACWSKSLTAGAADMDGHNHRKINFWVKYLKTQKSLVSAYLFPSGVPPDQRYMPTGTWLQVKKERTRATFWPAASFWGLPASSQLTLPVTWAQLSLQEQDAQFLCKAEHVDKPGGQKLGNCWKLELKGLALQHPKGQGDGVLLFNTVFKHIHNLIGTAHLFSNEVIIQAKRGLLPWTVPNFNTRPNKLQVLSVFSL